MVLEEGEKGQTGFFLVHLKLNGGLLNQALKRVDNIEIEISLLAALLGFISFLQVIWMTRTPAPTVNI